MIDLLVRGGLAFTLPLTAIALAVLIAAGSAGLTLRTGRGDGAFRKRAVFHLGLFGLVFGMFSHAVSLYQMMRAIEAVGSVSPAMVAGGLRASLVAPAYGLGIFIGAMLLWFLLDLWSKREADTELPAEVTS